MTRRKPPRGGRRYRRVPAFLALFIAALGAVFAAIGARGGDRGAGAGGRGNAPTQPRPEPREPAASADAPVVAPVPANSPWASRAACLGALASLPQSNVPRVASWNLRWFPDGTSNAGAARTDIEWVACLVLHLQAPVVAVQEFREGSPAAKPVRSLLEHLSRLSGGRWDADFDGCPGNRQHVGFLFDRRLVEARAFRRLDELNPKGGCNGLLRPGHAGYFRFPGGPDLHLVSVHFKSGTGGKDLTLRKQSWSALPRAFAALQGEQPDPDVLVLGDFNTMGTGRGGASAETAQLERAVGTQSPAWRRLGSDRDCSEFSDAGATLLDQVLVVGGASAVAADSRVNVQGLCRELGCTRLDENLAPLVELSDHCPIRVDLTPGDRD